MDVCYPAFDLCMLMYWMDVAGSPSHRSLLLQVLTTVERRFCPCCLLNDSSAISRQDDVATPRCLFRRLLLCVGIHSFIHPSMLG